MGLTILKIFLCLTGVLMVNGRFQHSGFVVTAPHTFLVNSVERISVSLHSTSIPSVPVTAVNITVTLSSVSTILYRSANIINKGVTCLDVAVPYTKEPAAKLTVQLLSSDNSSSNLNTNTEQIVQLQYERPLVVISSNKPVYKPGENLVFRVLTFGHMFRQLHNKTWCVWIESPAKIRLQEWQNYTINGLAHFEFPLADEPDLGEYSLKVKETSTEVVTEKLVLVKEYILPKFEVIITPPPRILADSEQVVWKICSKYGYGKAVQGSLHIRVVIEAEGDTTWPEINHVTMLDYGGCENFTLSSQDIGLSDVNVRPRALTLTASVTERGTGVVLNNTLTSSVLDSAFVLHFQCSQYFKPGISYKGRIFLRDFIGKPVTTVNEKIQVCVKTRSKYELAMRLLHCWNYSSDFSAQIVFTLPPLPQPQNIQLIVITATAVDHPSKHYHDSSLIMMVQPTASQTIRPWYSPSGSFIDVTTRQPVRCGVAHSVYVRYTVANISDPTPLFFYVVESRGDILFLRSIHPKSETVLRNSNTVIVEDPERTVVNTIQTKSWRLPLRIVPEMAPSSRVTVYYIRSDGEIVATSMPLLVDRCFPNKVRVHWSQLKAAPDSQVSMNIRATPNSLCSISTIDHRVNFNTPVQRSAADDLWTYINDFRHTFPPRDSQEYCQNKHEIQVEEEPPSYERRQQYKRSVLPPSDSSVYVDAITAFDDGGIRVLSNLVLETRPCLNSYDKYSSFERSASPSALENIQVVMPNSRNTNDITTQQLNKHLERYFFPEAWIWEMVHIGNQGEVIMNMSTPHSLTSWDTSVMCTSDTDGFGIGSTAMLTTWLPFFLQVDTPYAVHRREKVHIKISLYNYKYHNLPISLYVRSDEGLYVSSAHTAAACVKEQSSWTYTVTVEALHLGRHNLTVTAIADSSRVANCGPTEIFPATDTVTKHFFVRAEGFPVQKSEAALVCGQEPALVWNLNVSTPVMGSVKAKLQVVGDLLGPALQQLDKLVDKPTGCGEQNMVILAPNVYFVQYIDTKHKDRNGALRNAALKNIIKGYQHQLTFQRPDGSYSAFGKRDEIGSMWLTSFVVKTLGEARNLITVDEGNLRTSINWIVNNQLENGCFMLIGNVFHKEMQGGLSEGEESSPALTAYIVLSLTASGLQIRPSVLSSATTCIVKSVDSNDMYTLALSTLALARLGQIEKANEKLQLLLDSANSDNDLLHWEQPGSSLAFSVEVTSYTVMSLLTLGGSQNLVMANKAVRWIASQVNANGGFVSTQDTVVALEALTKYAVMAPISDNIDVRIVVNSQQLLDDKHFQINQDNRLVQQTFDIPVVPTTLTIKTMGEGCALVQYILKYNTETVEGSNAFQLHMMPSPLSTVDPCSMQKLEICARYLLPDLVSNMAVLTVMMQTGYRPDRESLHQITNVKHWEVEADRVVLYFDRIGADTTCFSMTLIRKVDTTNALPAVVTLFDYYYPEKKVSTEYRLHCNSVASQDGSVYETVAIPETESMMGDDPYENFHEVDFELATPGGIEGPVPAYACPPNVKPSECHIPPPPKKEE